MDKKTVKILFIKRIKKIISIMNIFIYSLVEVCLYLKIRPSKLKNS